MITYLANVCIFSGVVRRKVFVLDLDETLIHSNHDGVVRQANKSNIPPDFILKVTIERHPVKFFVHKRPFVDFFLDIVSDYVRNIYKDVVILLKIEEGLSNECKCLMKIVRNWCDLDMIKS